MKRLLILGLAALCGVASAQVNLTTIPQGTTLSGNELILMPPQPSACNSCTVTTTPAAINSYVRAQSPAIPTSAAPTALVGTAAVTGSSGNFMDAASAPALNLGITPTWTGLHTFNGGIVVNSITTTGLTTNGATGGSPGSGGINATALEVNGVPVATTSTGCTYGSFSGNFNGFTSVFTETLYYTVCGYDVHLYSNGVHTGTSNATTLQLTNAPAAIVATAGHLNPLGSCTGFVDNDVFAIAGAVVVTSSYIDFELSSISGTYVLNTDINTFTGSGTKGLTDLSCSYVLSPQ